MIYIFDLDGTLTRDETLPLIAKRYGLENDINDLTFRTIRGEIPFEESFLKRTKILSNIDPVEISGMLKDIKLNVHTINFIKNNLTNCVIATGNFRGWINELCEKIGCKYYCSEGEWKDGKLTIEKILIKKDIVKFYKDLGEDVVYIGDGNNDAEAMKLADIKIACGIVHQPSISIMEICDYCVYSDKRLSLFLNQIKNEGIGQTVVISCAGIGSRLGLGVTKTLLKINDKYILLRILENFRQESDIRIVVGFQYFEVIKIAKKFNKSILFVFNRNYMNTKTAISLYLGSKYANKYVVSWDGDFLAYPPDVQRVLDYSGEVACCVKINSEEPVFANVNNEGKLIGFSNDYGNYEWSGIVKLLKTNVVNFNSNIFNTLYEYLPMDFMLIDGMDIDTILDYQKAKSKVNNWELSNKNASIYYDKLALKIKSPLETRNKAIDFTDYDVELVSKYSKHAGFLSLLELGAGTGLMTNKLYKYFDHILAVEKYKSFSNYININSNVTILNEDILELQLNYIYDICTLFGVMNFFNNTEAKLIYNKVQKNIKKGGLLIVKNNMGIDEDVIINGYSDELDSYYFSIYRSIESETKILEDCGFKIIEILDIYPAKFNRWVDTHFWAIICQKI